MAIAALLWNILDDKHQSLTIMNDTINPVLPVIYGLLLGVIIIIISIFMNKVSESARNLSKELKKLLGDISQTDVWIFAAASAIGEEMFFRGPLLYHAGLILSTVIFALLHGFFEKKFILWSIFALIVGFGLGELKIITGGVLSPIIAHFTINLINLFLIRHESDEPSPTDIKMENYHE